MGSHQVPRPLPDAPPSPQLKFLPLSPVLGAPLPGRPAAPCAHAHYQTPQARVGPRCVIGARSTDEAVVAGS